MLAPNVTRQRRLAAGVCLNCGKEPLVNKTLGALCREQQNEAHRQKRLAEVAQRTPKACLHCGVVYGVDYKPKGGKPKKFCSRACNEQYKADANKAITAAKPLPSCVVCGAACPRSVRGRTVAVCSDTCRLARPSWYEQNKLTHLPKIRQQRFRERSLRPERECPECKDMFVPVQGNRKYCSAKCTRKVNKRIGKRVRRARKRNVPYESVDSMVVFARDGWRCQLCGCQTPKRYQGQMRPEAPELDHIIPLSLGGHHTYENTQCACRECNGKKSNKIQGQLRLCG